MIRILINGQEQNTVSALDRGLHYGDGVFETMRVCDNQVQLWEYHWNRLQQGCQRLRITLAEKNIIEQEILLLSEKNNKHVIKLIMTRGEGQRGYRFSKDCNSTRIIISYPWVDYPATYHTKGVSVRYCETILSENKQLAGIKHLNRLEQVLARNEWEDEYQEGLMLTSSGHVVDGTMSNVFAVKNNILYTPDITYCGVAGVMRTTIIKLAKELNIQVVEKIITPDELAIADEIFLTNSLFGIWPVREIAKVSLNKSGIITRKLQQKMTELFGDTCAA